MDPTGSNGSSSPSAEVPRLAAPREPLALPPSSGSDVGLGMEVGLGVAMRSADRDGGRGQDGYTASKTIDV